MLMIQIYQRWQLLLETETTCSVVCAVVVVSGAVLLSCLQPTKKSHYSNENHNKFIHFDGFLI